MILTNSMMPSINQSSEQYLNRNQGSIQNSTSENTRSFSQILADRKENSENTEPLKFSKHAMCRLNDRQISLSDEQMNRLTEGKQKAESKGINESLVLVDELAFIVNIKNNTVVTAMDSTKADESVYTNIDGAVIA